MINRKTSQKVIFPVKDGEENITIEIGVTEKVTGTLEISVQMGDELPTTRITSTSNPYLVKKVPPGTDPSLENLKGDLTSRVNGILSSGHYSGSSLTPHTIKNLTEDLVKEILQHA